MSNTVDKKVVEMEFDNSNFESNVKTSMSTLEKLKEKLDFGNSSDEFEKIGRAAANTDFSGFEKSLDGVSVKFDGLRTIAETVFERITNTVLDAAGKVKDAFSQLTTTPITTGLQEYETQINAIQTIISNTKARQKQADQEVLSEIASEATAATEAAKQAKKDQLEYNQEYYAERLKQRRRAQQDELDALRDQQEEEKDILVEEHKDALEALEKERENQLDFFDRLAEEEIETCEKKYDAELSALEQSIREETRALEAAHKEKLDMYEEEYMEKLKSIDEDRYNQIKAIDDEIDAINALTEAEERERKEKEQSEKLAELENAVASAKTVKDREKAEKALNDYREKLEQDRIKAERKQQVEELKAKKETVNEEYKLAKQELKQEYDDKKEAENEQYKLAVQEMKDEQDEKKKLLKETYEEEKKLLKKEQEWRKKQNKEEYDEKIEQLKKEQEAEKKALDKTHEQAISAIQDQHEDALDAIEAEKKAKQKAIEENHALTLASIESERSARVAAANEAAGMTEKASYEDIAKSLDELNKYADDTIYNFTNMTRAIGMFTSSGVGLTDSVQAIKGLSNLAAQTGTTAEQLNHVYLQIAQGLSGGVIRKIDWRSLVSVNMAGPLFEDALKESARVRGIAIDELIAKEGNFADSLAKGWLTSEIFLEAMRKFSGDISEEELRTIGYTEEQIKSIVELGREATNAATEVKTLTQLWDTMKETAQSGWTKTWEIIIGDFYEAKAFLTKLQTQFGDMIDSVSDKRNNMLQEWSDNGGRDALLSSIDNVISAIQKLVVPIRDTWEKVFPPMTGEKLAELTKGFADFTSSLVLNDDQQEQLMTTFEGLFRVIKLFTDFVSTGFSKASELIGSFFKKTNEDSEKTSKSFLDYAESFGEYLIRFADWVEKNNYIVGFFDKVNGVILKTIGFLKNLGAQILAIPQVQSFVSKFKELLKIPEEGFESFGAFITWLEERFTEARKNITDDFLKIKDSIGNYLALAYVSVTSFIGKLTGKFQEIDWLKVIGSAFAIGSGIGTLKLLKGFSSLLNAIGKPLKAVTKLIKSGGDIIKGFASKLKASAFNEYAVGIKNIAISIGILAASLFVLAQVPTEKLEETVIEFLKMVVIFVGAVATLKILDAFIEEVLSSGKVKDKLSGFFDSLKGLNILAIALSFIAFSASVKILVGAIKDLSAVKMSTSSIMPLITLGVMLVAFAGILEEFSNLKNVKATAVLSVPLTMILMMTVLEKLGKFDSEKILKSIIMSGIIIAELFFVTKIVSGIKEDATKKALIFLEFAGSALLLGFAIEKLGTLSSDVMWQGSLAILAMMGAIELLQIAASYMSGTKELKTSSATSILAMAGAALILSLAIEKLGEINFVTAEKGVFALLQVGAILAGLMFVSQYAKGSALTLLALAAAVVVLAGALTWLSLINDTDGIMGASKALSLLVAAFGIAIIGSGFAKKAIGSIMLMLVAVGILAALLTTLNALEIEPSLETAEAISMLLVAMTVALDLAALASAGGTNWKAADSLMLMSVVAALAGGLVGLLEKLDVAPSIETALAIAVLINGLAVAIDLLIPAGALFKEALIGIGVLFVFVLAFGALALGVGALADKYPFLEDMIDIGIPLLNKVASGLGEFVGNLIGGIGLGILDNLPAMADKLTEFSEHIAPFAENMSGINEDAVAGVRAVNDMILSLTGANIVSNLGGFIASILPHSKNLEDFTASLPALATNLKSFSDNLQGTKTTAAFDGAIVKKAAEILEDFGPVLKNTPKVDSDKIANFKKNVSTMGTAITDFSTAVSGKIDILAITTATAAASELTKLVDSIPADGFLAKLTGEAKDISSFGEKLKKFGTSLITYSNTVNTMTMTDVVGVEVSALVTGALVKVVNSIPKNGFFANVFGANTDLETFSENLETFALALVTYAAIVKVLSSDDVTQIELSIMLCKDLMDLTDRTEPKGIKTLGGSIADFGKDIAKFIDYLDDSSSEEVAEIAEVIDGLSNILSGASFDTAGGESKWKSYVNTMFAGLKGYTSDLLKYVNDEVTNKSYVIKTNIGDNLDDILYKADEFSVSVERNVETLLDSIVSIMDARRSGSTKAVSDFIAEIVKTVVDKNPLYTSAGEENALKYSEGITNKTSTVVEAVKKFVGDIVATLNGAKEDFRKSGEYVGQGFEEGIRSKEAAVTEAAKALAKKAEEGTSKELKINSPSKVFESLGEFSGEGFMNGLAESGKKAAETAKEFGGNVISGIKDMINGSSIGEVIGGTVGDVKEQIRNELGGLSEDVSSMIDMDDILGEALSEDSLNSMLGGENGFDLDETFNAENLIGSDTFNFDEILDNSMHDLEDSFEDYSGSFDLSSLMDGSMNGFTDSLDKFGNDLGLTSIMDDSLGSLGSYSNKYYDTSALNIESLASGITDNSWRATDATSMVADDSIFTFFDRTSEYGSVGEESASMYANGLLSGSDTVREGASKLADIAIGELDKRKDSFSSAGENVSDSYLSSALQSISEMTEEDLNINPVITPVIDMTDVQNGVKQINKLITYGKNPFKSSSELDQYSNIVFSTNPVTRAADIANAAAESASGSIRVVNGRDDESVTAPNVTNNNTFNISGDNPKEIAEEVSKILKKQVERKDASWA